MGPPQWPLQGVGLLVGGVQKVGGMVCSEIQVVGNFARLKDIWPSFRENRARLDVTCQLIFLNLVANM